MKINTLILLIIIGCVIPVTGQVKIYQKPLALPTYEIEEPEIMPDWRQYRYPYTMYDRLTNEKAIKTYNAIYVENEYVKALILPEIGGRFHGATDKTNGYEFLYDQKVIKPGLISTTGAWISGGVEWNFPIGHRPSCFRETDWLIQENNDGSKTAWVGEIDRITGMRWAVGTTVHPGRNWVETKIRLFNCTPYVQRFQYWATSAVRATNNYQAVIPGEVMTGHGKREFYHWPENDGVDISYWKNIPGAGSYFAVDSESDYFGGYSPEEKGGMVHYANHHIVRGKKLWTWGTAPAGRLWERILTDGDLPYFEPQAGAYSDNQPSLFWIIPGETKIFSHFWFPLRDIGVFDYANLEGSLNLELNDGKAIFGWSPTGKNKDAIVIVTYEGKEIYRSTVNSDPATPFIGRANVPENADIYQLKMIVLSSAKDTLLSFNHPKPLNNPLPEPKPLPPPPDQVESQDMLYIIGDRLNKYNNVEQAKQYFLEALKRDVGDIRSNTALGEIELKNGFFVKALDYFNTSLERDEDYFKAWYYKGQTELLLGNTVDAEKSLNRSSYSQNWYAAAHFELAQLVLRKNSPKKALEHIQRSIRGNGDNTEAHAIKALVLCQLNQYEDAMNIIRENLTVDPLNFLLHALKINILEGLGTSDIEIKNAKDQLKKLLRRDSENHIELALRFGRCGRHSDAIAILNMLIEEKDAIPTPLIYYYKAYYEHLSGNESKAVSDLKIASATSSKYCFPNRLESFAVLEWSLSEIPEDATAHHLLATLLYSRSRTEDAVAHWEKSVALNPNNAVAHRNLGLAYNKQGNLQKARNAYQAAIKADPSAGKAIVELGLLNKETNLPYDEQIDFFERNIEIVATYNQAVSQLIELYVLTEQYKEALKWLNNTHFNSWEGRYGIHQLWVQGNIKQGDIELNNRNFDEALDYYKQSLTYPENLEVAEQPNTIHARKFYKIAQALEGLGKKEQAKVYYNKIIVYNMEENNAYQFYKAQALEALGEKRKAQTIYEKMLAKSTNTESLDQQEDPMLNIENNNNSAKAVELYIRSLALEGLNKMPESEKLRSEAYKLYPLVELSAFSPPRFGY